MSFTRKVCLTLGTALSTLGMAAVAHAQDDRPNILLIVVDDMGMADLGSFGGEIPTPNLDSLAEQGVRLTNFHASAVCSPSRAMLMTGVDNHLAGLGNMAEELSPNQEGQPGYEGRLNDRVVTIATLLGDAGYDTFMTGKWHLGAVEGSRPSDRGFDRSFAMLSGGASHFADMRPAYSPDPDGKAPYMEDGQPLTELPANFGYSSQFYVDQMIEYLDSSNGDESPFFAYLAFTAPHWPLQAPAATIAKYKGQYDAGYDALFTERLARQKELGIVPEDVSGGRLPLKYIPWTELPEQQRKVESRAMEIYAAMIDEIDSNTGRLIDSLEASGKLDNTVIVFMSDNGAEGHDLDETWPGDLFPEIRRNIDERHDFSYEAMGAERSYVLYGPGWARAGSPALSLFKGFPTEGGIRVPAFVTINGVDGGRISDRYYSIEDIAPTLLELAGVQAPDGSWDGRPVEAISGTSMLNSLVADDSEDAVASDAGEILGKSFIREGDWKAVRFPAPYGSGEWQLFNLADDLGETDDLAATHPDKLDGLLGDWDEYVTKVGVVMPDWVSGY